jgi:hypothetical protein
VSETLAPPAGAAAVNVTVPVLVDPLLTVAGENDTPRTHAAVVVVVVAAVNAEFAVIACALASGVVATSGGAVALSAVVVVVASVALLAVTIGVPVAGAPEKGACVDPPQPVNVDIAVKSARDVVRTIAREFDCSPRVRFVIRSTSRPIPKMNPATTHLDKN